MTLHRVSLYAMSRVLRDSMKMERHLRPAAMSDDKNGVVSIYAWRVHQSVLEEIKEERLTPLFIEKEKTHG
jgi:hypothetical protein